VAVEQLTLKSIPVDSKLYHCHQCKHDPCYFAANQIHRFDAPLANFSTCYFSLSAYGAFAESLINRRHGQLLSMEDMTNFCLSVVTLARPLQLVHCHGEGLTRNGIDSSIASTSDRVVTMALSARLHAHTQLADGLVYRARHDDDQFSVVLYDRARSALDRIESKTPWRDTGSTFEDILDRYQIALV